LVDKKLIKGEGNFIFYPIISSTQQLDNYDRNWKLPVLTRSQKQESLSITQKLINAPNFEKLYERTAFSLFFFLKPMIHGYPNLLNLNLRENYFGDL
jgi:hypothetical protein